MTRIPKLAAVLLAAIKYNDMTYSESPLFIMPVSKILKATVILLSKYVILLNVFKIWLFFPALYVCKNLLTLIQATQTCNY